MTLAIRDEDVALQVIGETSKEISVPPVFAAGAKFSAEGTEFELVECPDSVDGQCWIDDDGFLRIESQEVENPVPVEYLAVTASVAMHVGETGQTSSTEAVLAVSAPFADELNTVPTKFEDDLLRHDLICR